MMVRKYSGIIIEDDLYSERVDFYEKGSMGQQLYNERLKEIGECCKHFWSEQPKTRSKLIEILGDFK